MIEVIDSFIEQLASQAEDQRRDSIANDSDRIIFYAVGYPDKLKQIIALLPENERRDVMFFRASPRHSSPNAPRPVRIYIGRQPYSNLEPSEIAKLEMQEKQEQQEKTAARMRQRDLENKLPAALRTTLTKLMSDNAKNALLHMALAYSMESFNALFDLLSEADRLAIVLELSEITPTYSQQRRYVKINYKQLKQTLLHQAATQPELLRLILDNLGTNKRLEALSVKSVDAWGTWKGAVSGQEGRSTRVTVNLTALHMAIECPAALEVIMESLPLSDRLAALLLTSEKETTICYETGVPSERKMRVSVLQQASDKPESLQVLLGSLSARDRLVAQSRLYPFVGRLFASSLALALKHPVVCQALTVSFAVASVALLVAAAACSAGGIALGLGLACAAIGIGVAIISSLTKRATTEDESASVSPCDDEHLSNSSVI